MWAGIQYQSYQADSIVAESEHLYLTSGLGHTGSIPFDDNQGWYRSYRGLAGSISYKAKLKGWQPSDHRKFPKALRDAVRTMLLCQNRIESTEGGCNDHSASFSASAGASGRNTISSAVDSSYGTNGIINGDDDGSATAIPSLALDEHTNSNPSACQNLSRNNDAATAAQLMLSKLPKYTIYNILEFMVN